MSIKIGPTSQLVPMTPTSSTYTPAGTDQNALGPQTSGLSITDQSTKTTINVGLTPTSDTTIPSINVGTANVPNTFTGQLRVFSGGPTIVSQ